MIRYILLLLSTLSSLTNATAIMQYPNALNRDALQSLQNKTVQNEKIMTIFESNTYSLDTIQTMLNYYDPSLSIISNKESGTLIILHNKNQKETLTNILEELNLLPIKIHIDCYIYEINKEFEKELNLLNSPLEQGIQISYKNPPKLHNTLGLLDTIKTLEKKGHASLIAHPKFNIENGKSASLIIGEKLPYINSVTNTTSTTQSLHHVQTGLNITIQSTIISKNQIQCKVECKLSNVKLWKTINNNNYPILSSRNLIINTIVKNNTLTLITTFKDSISKTYQSHNPLIKKIPFLKKLIKLKTKKTKETQLFILLKPTIRKTK